MKKLLLFAVMLLTLGACKKQDAFTQSFQAPVGDIRALYIRLGNNMWCDWPVQTMGSDLQEAVKLLPENKRPDLRLTTVDSLWRKVTDYAAANGVNMLVVDLGEGLQYPSHPELAVRNAKTKEIIHNVNLSLPSGKLTVITGPNGGGKSTLARLIAGIEKPSEGRILLNDVDITGKTIHRLRLPATSAVQGDTGH